MLPYGGGPVLHSNRTHPIFWEPAGSGLTFDPGYESLIETFLIDVAADSHKTTNVVQPERAVHRLEWAGGVRLDLRRRRGRHRPAAAKRLHRAGPTGPGWTVCLTDAQLETELEHVIAADHLPTTNRDVYFIDHARRLRQLHRRGLVELRARGQRRTATAAITPRRRTGSCTR